MRTIKIVVASRKNEADFFSKTALGQSLRNFDLPFIELCLFSNNAVALPTLYNSIIDKSLDENCVLIFIHDDVFLLDYFWIDQVLSGFEYFNIIGIAGNKRRLPYQPSWAFKDLKFAWDEPEYLSGVIGHGLGFPPDSISIFGPPNQQVMSLDGVFMAIESKTCAKCNLRFDNQFQFHFYDLDFCRQAEVLGLKCGTIALSMIHQSAGNFSTPEWRMGYDSYISKWGN